MQRNSIKIKRIVHNQISELLIEGFIETRNVIYAAIVFKICPGFVESLLQ
jgi:hypothetical protein